jgi:hypothetical protein
LHSSQTRLALFRPVAFEGTFASFNAITAHPFCFRIDDGRLSRLALDIVAAE